jgi:hypothetical protein
VYLGRIPSCLPKAVVCFSYKFPFFHVWILRVQLVGLGMILGWSSGLSIGMAFAPCSVFALCRILFLGSKCIHRTTITYTKRNIIEKAFNLTNGRGSLMQGVC